MFVPTLTVRIRAPVFPCYSTETENRGVKVGVEYLAPQASSVGSEWSIQNACRSLADEIAGYQGW